MRFAKFTAQGRQHYGGVAEGRVIALSDDHPQWTSLRDVLATDGFKDLAVTAQGRDVTSEHGEFHWDILVPHPEKAICVGANYPDRNAEYRDGQDALPNMSLVSRFPGPLYFMRLRWPGRPKPRNWTMKAKLPF